MAHNILLISNDININNTLLKKLLLLRDNDSVKISTFENVKLLSSINSDIIIINTIDNEQEEIFKCIDYINEITTKKIFLLLDNIDYKFIFDAYDKGIFDYFSINDESYSISIKIMNCLKFVSMEEINSRNNDYLLSTGAIDFKTGLYTINYIKEIYNSITSNKKYQNGVFAILTLDESIKTKVSTNRLALAIKKNIRRNDLAAIVKGGYFYLFLQNINVENAENIIYKLQTVMGEECKIRAGLANIGIQDFEVLKKAAKDSLNSAILHDQTVMALSSVSDDWLEDDNEKSKQYKLFKVIYENKLKYIIEPVFFKTQKDFSKKLRKTNVTQYVNSVESSFGLKNDNQQSELLIRFDGFSKLNIQIIHSGLDSEENSKYELNLKKLTEKELSKLLKQLYEEFTKSNIRRETLNAE